MKTRRRIPAYYDEEEEIEPVAIKPRERENSSVLEGRRKPFADDRGKQTEIRQRPSEYRQTEERNHSEERSRPIDGRYRNEEDRNRQNEERYKDVIKEDRQRPSQKEAPQAVPKVKELSDKNYNIYAQPRAVPKFTPKLFKPNRLTTTIPDSVDLRKPSEQQSEKSNYSSEKYEKYSGEKQRQIRPETTTTTKSLKTTEPPLTADEEYSYEEYYEDELQLESSKPSKEVAQPKKQPVDISIEKSYKRPLIISRGKY